jgi:hypothetical protein
VAHSTEFKAWLAERMQKNPTFTNTAIPTRLRCTSSECLLGTACWREIWTLNRSPARETCARRP